MSGIFGIISRRPSELNIKELGIMSSSIFMENSLNLQTLLVQDHNVYVGWLCHKGSFSDCLPIENEKKDCILIYSGENLNDSDILDKLKRKNHIYNRKNASFLVHLYEEYGEKFLKLLNGVFSGLIIDKKRRKVFLFNDRYGIQKIYYYENADAFYFSNQAKSILKILPIPVEVDPESFAELFTYNCVIENRSLFKGVLSLPPGSYWVFSDNESIDKNSYFKTTELESQTLLESEFHYEKLLYSLRNILKRYFKSDENILIHLDGSIDVRIVLANAMYGLDKVKCYAIGEPISSVGVINTAYEISKITGLSLIFVNLDKDFFCNFKEYAERSIYISDGIGDLNSALELYFYRKLKDIASVKICNDHGATILRGEQLIKRLKYNSSLFSDDFKFYLNAAIYERSYELKSTNLNIQLNVGMPSTMSGKWAIWQSQMIIRTPFLDNDIVNLMYRSVDRDTESKKTSLRLIMDGNKFLAGICNSANNDRSFWNKLNFFKNINFKSKKSNNQNIEHAYLCDLYKNELSVHIKDILFDTRSLSRPYISKEFIKAMVDMHTEGKADFTIEIGLALRAELINRVFIDLN
jgi:asparagine synthase (glutamine-hydrolysing)